MDNTINLTMTEAEAEQFRALIVDCLENLRLANARMDQDEREIEKLKTETRSILKQLKESLHVETSF